jgi:hypothetical protein
LIGARVFRVLAIAVVSVIAVSCRAAPPSLGAILRLGENAMIIVVEVADRRGQRAFKEYDQPTLRAAINVARRELHTFPDVHIIDVWIKSRTEQSELGTSDDW